jgi:peptidoglycan/LPS O-acetylase OafA/YrhL
MNASEGAFRALLAVGLGLLVLTTGLFTLQEPETAEYAITVLSLAVQVVMVLVAAAGLYFRWDPLGPLVEEE